MTTKHVRDGCDHDPAGMLDVCKECDPFAMTWQETVVDAIECLKRLPDVDGAYRITNIQQLERVLRGN